MTATHNWPILEKLIREEEAELYCSILQQNDIQYHLNQPKQTFSVATGITTQDVYWVIQVPEEVYNQADECLNRAVKDSLVIEPGYYLEDYSNEELKQVLAEKDNNSRFDYVAAIQLLENRGQPVPETQLQALTQRRNQELFRERDTPVALLIVGGAFLFVMPLMSMLIGIYMNLLYTHDLTGKRFYSYNSTTRKLGLSMLILGILLAAWSIKNDSYFFGTWVPV